MKGPKIVVVGGVAAGASCAARARRLAETAEIVVFERGRYVSFANCGLPYHIGGEISDRSRLLVQTPEKLRRNLNLDVRTEQEVLSIDRGSKSIRVRSTAGEYDERYDFLVLATGAAPLRPRIPGIERPGHFTLRDIPDMDAILKWISERSVKTVVIVGGGYVGLEMMEQLHRRGLHVTVIEALPQVMSALDPEMAEILHEEIRVAGVDLVLGDSVARFEPAPEYSASRVILSSGTNLGADLVIVGIGVRPETGLARTAGLETGARGGVRVDEFLQTSDPSIYAAGDCIEVRDAVTEEWSVIPLAGPANRQGRLIADNILSGKKKAYAGTQGTAVLRLFSLTAGCTGVNEKTLSKLKRNYRSAHLFPGSHAGYFPGAERISMKILFDPESRRLLGAQAVGKVGVDKRVDVLATAIRAGMTVDDLADLELCYAPPFGSAKDPVNIAGMIGQNILDGLVEAVTPGELRSGGESSVVVDVREERELAEGRIPGSISIPLSQIRERLGELPRDREIVVSCQTGQRSYNACRILAQRGYRCRSLSGGYEAWRLYAAPTSDRREREL